MAAEDVGAAEAGKVVKGVAAGVVNELLLWR